MTTTEEEKSRPEAESLGVILPPDLKQELRERARYEARSMSSMAMVLIRDGLRGKPASRGD